MEKGALTFPGGPTFPRWRGSNCIFLYKPIEFVIFQGAGVRTPATSSGSARGIVNWVRSHIILAKRLSMTLTPLMQGSPHQEVWEYSITNPPPTPPPPPPPPPC